MEDIQDTKTGTVPKFDYDTFLKLASMTICPLDRWENQIDQIFQILFESPPKMTRIGQILVQVFPNHHNVSQNSAKFDYDMYAGNRLPLKKT